VKSVAAEKEGTTTFTPPRDKLRKANQHTSAQRFLQMIGWNGEAHQFSINLLEANVDPRSRFHLL
jgi:hypothetical protein